MSLTKMVCGVNYTTDVLRENVNGLIDAYGGKSVAFVAGVIRNDGTGWKLIDDTFHTGLNVTSVSNDATKISINYTAINATKVLSMVVGNDETYARKGYSVGSSVAKTVTEIFVHKTSGNRSAALLQYNTATGVTIPFGQSVGITSVSWDAVNKVVTVNHDGYAINHLSVVPNISPRRTCPSAWKIDGVTTNQTTFWFEDSAGTKITPTDGAQFFFDRGDGYIKENIDPSTVNDPIGNFWFIGVFEI